MTTGNEAGVREDDVWRLFTAVALPDDVRRALAGEQERLKRCGARVGWVAPENLHLTMVFLGDTFAGRVPALAAALDGAVAPAAPFDFEVAGLGAFGSPRSPRVIWAGVTGPPPDLPALHARVAAAVSACGVRLESRPFAAHVTLGRVRSSQGAGALTAALASPNFPSMGRAVAGSVLLMRSILGRAGPQYSVVHESLLKGD